MDSMVYWIWLSQACTPGSTTFGKLIKEYKSARAIYEAEDRRIADVIGYKTSDRSSIEDKNLERAAEILDFCTKHKVGLLCYNDPAFPEALRRIDNPPVLLYYRGVLPDFNKTFAVATVGTRSLSDYGRKNAFRISYDLAKAGATIVSGMAIGIDGVCMAGALAAGGKTIAVIGSGIDVCYPPQHLKLAREIVKSGCVITEFAPGTKPVKYNFPKRNRLISGLCDATVVFEGAEKSGALITARYAKEQGRKLYALPGNVGSENSQLSNLLIKNGASICTKAEDVLGDFSKNYPEVINPFRLQERIDVNMMETLRFYEISAVCTNDDIFEFTAPQIISVDNSEPVGIQNSQNQEIKAPPANFDKNSLKVYKKIPANGSCSIESLVGDDLSLREVMRYLLKLEVDGFVRLLPGEMVTRKFK